MQLEEGQRIRAPLLSGAEDFFFTVEATRVRLAYQFDPHLAISVSQVDLLPHQKIATRSAQVTRAHSYHAFRAFARRHTLGGGQ